MKNYVISVGREFCSGGREIGKMLAKRLDIHYYDDVELRTKARDMGVEDGIFDMFDEQPTKSFLFSMVMDPYAIDNAVNEGKVLEAQRKVILKAAEEGSCVIVGRRADKILEGKDGVDLISVFIGADIDDRVQEYKKRTGESPRSAVRLIQRKDRERASYYNYLGDGKWGAASNYTMCFSTSKISKENIVEIIAKYVEKNQ